MRQPTRPAPVPTNRPKSKKRRADELLEDKTDVLEEGELATAWLLNEMDQATQTDPIPYAPVDRPGVWLCPLHPDETLSEGRKGEFVYVYCPRNTCPVFSPQDRVDEWMTVTQQLHNELCQRWDDLTCFCDRRLALRKSGSEKNPQRMYLACRDGDCRCFLWLNLPLSGKMRRRVDGDKWNSDSLPRAKRECLAVRLRGVDR